MAEKEEVRKRRPQRVTEGPLRGPQFKFIMRWVKYHWNVGPFGQKLVGGGAIGGGEGNNGAKGGCGQVGCGGG